MRLLNKTALIIEGNSGIGLAMARLFAAEGARVAIVGRNKETLEGSPGVVRRGEPVPDRRAGRTLRTHRREGDGT